MNKIAIIISVMFFLSNGYTQEKSTETIHLKKFVLSMEDEKETFESTVENSSKEIIDWAKKNKVQMIKYKPLKTNKNEEKAKESSKTLEDEVNSKEFKDWKEELANYINKGNPAKVREMLETMKNKFPLAYEADKNTGVKYNIALTYLMERNYSQAKKFLNEVIAELRRKYPKGFNPQELSESDKNFIYNVFGKRGVINLFYENNYLEASDDLETVVKLMPTNEKDPNYYKVYTLLSSALIMQNRVKEAAEYYNKALYLYPDLPEKRHNEYVNICKNIVNAGYLEFCPKCKDWDK